MNPFLSVVAGPMGLALVLKVSLLLLAALVLASLLRHRSTAARHMVWLTALSGTLALAVLTPFAPRLAIDIPAPSIALPAPLVAPHPLVSDRAGVTSSPAMGATDRSSTNPSVGVDRVSTAAPMWRPVSAVGGLWLAGFLAVVLWSAFGHLGLWALNRKAIPVERGNWTERFGAAPPPSGTAAHVRLGISPAVGTPLTWGWLRPIVLLPAAAEAWPVERRRAALLHELAHVSRSDYLAQVIAMLACAVWWFHPLVWWSAGRLRSESEHACDDCVLAAGTSAPDYATDLLEVAHGARSMRGSALVAVAMARRSHLEGRLLAVLDETRQRGGIRARVVAATLAVALLLLIPFAALEPRLIAAGAGMLSQSEAPAPAPVVITISESAGASRLDAAEATGGDTEITIKQSDAQGGEAFTVVRSEKDESRASDSDDENLSVSERTLPAKAGGRLDLELDNGGSVEIRGWDRPEVSVDSHLGGRDWAQSRVRVSPTANGVRVHGFQAGGKHSFSTSHHFRIRVPSRFDVRLNSAGGGLTIVDVRGSFRGTTGGGELVLERARGSAALSTGGGDIKVSDSDLSGTVSTGGGMVLLSQVRGGLRGSSGSGPVIYSDHEDGGADDETGDLSDVLVNQGGKRIDIARRGSVGTLNIRKAGGGVDLDEAPRGANVHTGGGDIRIGHAGGTVSAVTGGGDIMIGPAAGSVTAGTGAGDVHVIVADAGREEQTVEITSGKGDITVDLPGGFDGRLELETSFTEGHRHSAKITSSWSLDRDEITPWDDREGTARRYVRARGEVGDGQGLVRIKTVNGNIEVRRRSSR